MLAIAFSPGRPTDTVRARADAQHDDTDHQAITAADRPLLDACAKQAIRTQPVQDALRAHDQAAFTTALTTTIAALNDPADTTASPISTTTRRSVPA
ncbi:hypothetical protein ABT336_02445 [Micromonospora sp. NPDC000207]|uniref:hypothetical protein n=1 Tax=Micromonospora sp. NPDC000207 TaxID=3154246 RepID=UPI003325358C